LEEQGGRKSDGLTALRISDPVEQFFQKNVTDLDVSVLDGTTLAFGDNWSRREEKMKDDLDEIPLSYVLYIVLGLLVMVAGTGFMIFRMFRP
jgi:hypothetical protein